MVRGSGWRKLARDGRNLLEVKCAIGFNYTGEQKQWSLLAALFLGGAAIGCTSYPNTTPRPSSEEYIGSSLPCSSFVAFAFWSSYSACDPRGPCLIGGGSEVLHVIMASSLDQFCRPILPRYPFKSPTPEQLYPQFNPSTTATNRCGSTGRILAICTCK